MALPTPSLLKVGEASAERRFFLCDLSTPIFFFINATAGGESADMARCAVGAEIL
jgi:hypothetical protein